MKMMTSLTGLLIALPHLILIFVLSDTTSMSHETSESSEEDLTIIETDFELSSNRHSIMPEVYRTAKVKAPPKPTYNMSCKCGLGRIGEIRNSSGQPRIVNGYVPETRPWMAYIQVRRLSLVYLVRFQSR